MNSLYDRQYRREGEILPINLSRVLHMNLYVNKVFVIVVGSYAERNNEFCNFVRLTRAINGALSHS